ncbi:MAG: hypothetical protein SFU85_02260 [Candidatus Methylacidiphilales bacterium]|nr:hypothetical protein [Candidatus Methylacidiphilales bacterium]
MSTSLFSSLSSTRIAAHIARARTRICYAAPGIHDAPAAALAAVKSRSPGITLSVSLDFSEHTLRMGYGTLEAVETLRKAGIQPILSPGFRCAVLIVDDGGWVYTPTALYLEAEPQSEETPNAIRLIEAQVHDMLLRLSPAARQEAITSATTAEEVSRIHSIPLEISEQPVTAEHVDQVKKAISTAPPVKFDLVRQVRVFEPYLQYVELSLTGAAVQRHRVRIPKELQNLGASKDLEGKLKTTFDLIEKDSSMSSKALEDELNEIRKNFTPSLGKDHGRVVLKSAKPHLTKRIGELRTKLAAHQKKVETELQAKLDESKKQVVDYYLPLAKANPPDALLGSLLQPNTDETSIREWIEEVMDKVFPSAKDLVRSMVLEERYKDVTFETLNHPDFLGSVKAAFPRIDWDQPFHDFKAAGESKESE